ncbi:MAG: hypothetical protein ABIQ74_02565 [Chitinophagales bacterium]
METNEMFSLTAVFVKDEAAGGYTAFFAQFKNIMAEGETEAEALTNLVRTVKVVFEHEGDLSFDREGISPGMIRKENHNLAFA